MKNLNLFKGNWLFVAISFLVGIAAILVSLEVLIVFGLLIFYFYYTNRGKFIFLCMSSVIVGLIVALVHESNHVTSFSKEQSVFVGVVHDQMKVSGSFCSFVLQVKNREKILVNYRIKNEEEKTWIESIRYGSFIKVEGLLEKGKEQRVENGFNYRAYLKHKKIHWIIDAKTIQFSKRSVSSAMYYFKNKRLNLIQHIKAYYSPTSSSFINALLFGDQSSIDTTLQSQYQQFGLTHLLAISGSHFTLLISFISLLLWRIGLTKERTNMVLLLVIPIYTILAGATPSVLRAGITGAVVVLSILFGYKKLALDLLSFVCVFLVGYNPYYIFDIGFQLSFFVSFVLILSSVRILHTNSSFLHLTFYVTLVSQIASLPIVLGNFNEISPYSLILNAFFIPFLSFIILPLCILAYFITYLEGYNLVDWLLSTLLNHSHEILNVFEFFPFGRLYFSALSFFTGILLWITIFLVFIYWEKKQGTKSIWLISMCLIVLLILPYFKDDGTITFLDVGQGDCIIIELPYRKGVYVIDTGGQLPFKKEEWEKGKETGVGERMIVPYLKSKGIHTIDKLIFTHGDYDHIGESDHILEEFNVKELLVGKKNKRSYLEEERIKLAHQLGVKVTECKSGMGWKVDDYIFSILTPYELNGEENNQSITIHTILGGKGFLFTGDLEKEGEKWLIEQRIDKKVDVLKVGHHGSKSSTSQEFLEYYQPSLCVVSVGENNRYSHPNDEVVHRIEKSGCELLRTDIEGSVHVSFNQNRIRVDRTKQKD